MRAIASVAALSLVTALAPSAARAQVGLAARLESGSPISAGVPILFGKGRRWMVEPIAYFDHGQGTSRIDSVAGPISGANSSNESHNTTLRTGAGLFYRGGRPVSVYFGPRIGYQKYSSHSEGRQPTPSGGFTNTQDVSLSGLWYGALLGAEASIGHQFAIGFELTYQVEKLAGALDFYAVQGGSPPQQGSAHLDTTDAFTQAMVVARWYPWRRAQAPSRSPATP